MARIAIANTNLSVKYWVASNINNHAHDDHDYIFHDSKLAISGIGRQESDLSQEACGKYLHDKFYCEHKSLIDVVEKDIKAEKVSILEVK